MGNSCVDVAAGGVSHEYTLQQRARGIDKSHSRSVSGVSIRDEHA